MVSDTRNNPQLRVGAHVLVQLGRELVTDPEQAILEIVKNAYDADSKDCTIEVDTRATGTLEHTSVASALSRFGESTDTVEVELFTPEEHSGQEASDESDPPLSRRLSYTGKICIRDKGDGLSAEAVRDSWLVVSNSIKRVESGMPKPKTDEGRTPLGDKGLGRLGTMRLGDILLLRSAQEGSSTINIAWFRWKDCDGAETLDSIPVQISAEPNTGGFKGTEVIVLGLNDLAKWRDERRAAEIAFSIAAIVSPFESIKTFPVSVRIDGKSYDMEQVTSDLLAQAVSSFDFKFQKDDGQSDDYCLVAKATFRQSVFTASANPEAADRARSVFSKDHGEEFLAWLKQSKKLNKKYDSLEISPGGDWVIEIEDQTPFSRIIKGNQSVIGNPGQFSGALHYFNFGRSGPAAAGSGATSARLKRVGGIAILRDGFRVRAGDDWLDLARSMTSGSTYHLRVDNTIGYFALSGEHNFRLTEKSDREGFVGDQYYRGFEEIAKKCRDFSNKAQEDVRRGLDQYLREIEISENNAAGMSSKAAVKTVKSSASSISAAAKTVAAIAETQRTAIVTLNSKVSPVERADEALDLAQQNLATMEKLAADFDKMRDLAAAGAVVAQEIGMRSEQVAALVESAAVGLAARGLTHELHTHLSEIERSTSFIRKTLQGTEFSEKIRPQLRHIDLARRAMSGAAAQIDPMLPRTRAVKERLDVANFIGEYFAARKSDLEREGTRAEVVRLDGALVVRMNRNRLLQVVDNLVLNSRYWLQDDGAPVSGDRYIRATVDSRGFTISDNGPGVEPKLEETLFELFVTEKPNSEAGQGLGLYITTQLLQLDGCTIELLDERNGKGRRHKFRVDLSKLVDTKAD